jgi:hypothetical protein
MSATRILAQSTPALLFAFPGWKQPTLCRIVMTGAGTSVPAVVAAKTTPGIEVTRNNIGQLDITFPACRDIAGINGRVYNADPDTAATNLGVAVDADSSLTSATAGKLRVLVFGEDNGTAEDLEPGDTLEVSFWLDLG